MPTAQLGIFTSAEMGSISALTEINPTWQADTKCIYREL